jgi:tRNA dimethylallyltransferase
MSTELVGTVLGALRDNELVCLVGPTASGKTELALHLAEQLNGEIVSVDSVQIYQGFDIGSGKPTPEERARAVHHLIDWVAPDAEVDAAKYVAAADACIKEIRARDRVPILCGGTFLWAKALLQGLANAPAADPLLRQQHRDLVTQHGREHLHAMLHEVDAEAAKRLHPNDFVRVSRALEVHTLTGRPLSALQHEHAFASARYPYRLFARKQANLLERIEARVRTWLKVGWIEETDALLAKGYADTRAMSAVGYREICAYLQGRMKRDLLEEKIVQSTKIYARRQKTWLNHEPVTWLE